MAAVSVVDTQQLAWQETGKPGVLQKQVRSDRTRGHFLGLIGIDSMVRSGLHQHLGVATSFFMSGGFTDYRGAIKTHEMGINLKGATHDAIAYGRTEFVARLEAPVIYPPEVQLHDLHAGARHGRIVNPAPEVAPDINIAVDTLAAAIVAPGVTRQLIFDYTPTEDTRRLVHLRLRPGSRLPRLRTGARTDFWVRGGRLEITGVTEQSADANMFIIVAPDAEITLASEYGALVLAWAEGPSQWLDAPRDSSAAELFGF